MGRIGEALALPFVVFPAAAVAAIAIAWILHQSPRAAAPFVALVMTIVVTAAGFVASSRSGKA